MMIRNREMRQSYLHDYAEEYCSTTDYGDLILQQRLLMVNWILQEATEKDLLKERMFLSVNLDRFLSKECCFKTKRCIQIAAIACLTLAARIEENQPFNSIWQRTSVVAGTSYSCSEVVAMESLLQEVLNFQRYLPTVHNSLWCYEPLVRTAKHQALLALLGPEHMRYRPSTVASAMVSLATAAANLYGSRHLVTKRFREDAVLSAPGLARLLNLGNEKDSKEILAGTQRLQIKIYSDADLKKMEVPVTYPAHAVFLKPDRDMSREEFRRVRAFIADFPYLVLLPLEGGRRRNKSPSMENYGLPLAIIGIVFWMGYNVVTTLKVITRSFEEVSGNINDSIGTISKTVNGAIDLWSKQGIPLNVKLLWPFGKTKQTGDSGDGTIQQIAETFGPFG